MKKKISTLVLALGITAAPAFAKQQNNRRAAGKTSSGVEQKGVQKRAANTLKRFLEVEAEKEFLKETEEEIFKVMNQSSGKSENSISDTKISEDQVVLSEHIPTNGIDISAEFNALNSFVKRKE